jgi:hypothetical protein
MDSDLFLFEEPVLRRFTYGHPDAFYQAALIMSASR